MCGKNGSGKTSVLEAIYVLGRGRSFRSADYRSLIRDGVDRFQLVASIRAGDGTSARVGMERGAAGFTVRVNGEPARTLAQLARLFPVLLINPDSHRLVEGGPQQRRRFLDWGVFQSEQRFLDVWKRFRSALRNRNAALRRYQDVAAIRAWDPAFVEFGGELDRLRRIYLENLAREFSVLASHLLPNVSLGLHYRAGWPQNKSLAESLLEALHQDRRLAQSRVGPHRGDLRVSVEDVRAVGRVSRGEQKLIAAALVLAQARALAANHGGRCVLLVDDLPSELDEPSRLLLLQALASTPAQQWLTSIEPMALPMFKSGHTVRYRIEAGSVSKMVY